MMPCSLAHLKLTAYVISVEVLICFLLVSTRSRQKSLLLQRTLSLSMFPASKVTARLDDWGRIQNEPWEYFPLV
jgi:hypothetical protein